MSLSEESRRRVVRTYATKTDGTRRLNYRIHLHTEIINPLIFEMKKSEIQRCFPILLMLFWFGTEHSTLYLHLNKLLHETNVEVVELSAEWPDP